MSIEVLKRVRLFPIKDPSIANRGPKGGLFFPVEGPQSSTTDNRDLLPLNDFKRSSIRHRGSQRIVVANRGPLELLYSP